MKLDNILGIINNLDYENIEDVEVPVAHLVKLRAEIVKLNVELKRTSIAHREAVAVGMKLMAEQMDDVVPHFNSFDVRA